VLIGSAANFLEGGSVHTYADGMSDRMPAIKVVMMPKDTNAHGTIFGGVILSNIDLASGVEAFKVAPHLFVTKAMREVEFHHPVFTGDLVSFYASTVRIGRTSVTIRVEVEAERWGWDAAKRGVERGERVKVTEAEVILVAVDADGRPVPIRPDPVTA
jgi:acyl-CoA thioesterase YciA